MSGVQRAEALAHRLWLQIGCPQLVSIDDANQEDRRTRVHYGYRRVHVMLKRDGWQDNNK